MGESGRYTVQAFIPETEADSQNASYKIFDGTTEHTVGPFNQSTQKGWIDLGHFDFEVGEDRWVMLGDNTGEAYDLRRKLGYDAMRLVPAPIDPEEPIPNPEEPLNPEDPNPPTDPNDPSDPSNPGEPQDPNDPNLDETPDDGGPMSVSASGGCQVPGGFTSSFLFLVLMATRRRFRTS